MRRGRVWKVTVVHQDGENGLFPLSARKIESLCDYRHFDHLLYSADASWMFSVNSLSVVTLVLHAAALANEVLDFQFGCFSRGKFGFHRPVPTLLLFSRHNSKNTCRIYTIQHNSPAINLSFWKVDSTEIWVCNFHSLQGYWIELLQGDFYLLTVQSVEDFLTF